MIRKTFFFTIYKLEEDKWRKIHEKLCSYGEHIEFSRIGNNLEPKKPFVIVPSENSNTPIETDCLPVPLSLRIDKSPINERASYNFSIKDVSTSYQGEVPFEMTKGRKKSFLAPDVLRLDQNKNDQAYVMLMNLSRFSLDQEIHEVNIFDIDQNKILEKFKVQNNHFIVRKLPKKSNSNFFITSKSAAFIPLFISIRKNKEYEINVEHTHPPHEMFLGEGRYKVLAKIKRKWIK